MLADQFICCAAGPHLNYVYSAAIFSSLIVFTGAAGHCKQHWVVTAAAAGTSNSKQQAPSKQQQPASSRGRNARLYELFDDDGWGVEAVVPAAQQPAASPAAAPAQPKRAQNPQQQTSEQGESGTTGVFTCHCLCKRPWLLCRLQNHLQVVWQFSCIARLSPLSPLSPLSHPGG